MKLRQLVIAALTVSATAAVAGGNKAHHSDTSKSKDQTAATSLNQQASVSGQNGSSMAGTNAAQSGTNAASAQDSESIRKAQQALNDKGFDAGKVDGTFGPHTQSAVMKFQQAQGIQQTGQLDSQTLAALGVQGGSANLSMSGTSGTNAGQPSSSAEAAIGLRK